MSIDGTAGEREFLRRTFQYDELTGKIMRVRLGRKKVVNGRNTNGYVQVFARKFYYGHRLAWFLHYGEWPSGGIDHIDGDPSNNRIANLRLANQSQNTANSRLSKRNKTGFKGVYRHSQNDCFVAQIVKDRKAKYLGSFRTAKAAHAAYMVAAQHLFGDYARAA